MSLVYTESLAILGVPRAAVVVLCHGEDEVALLGEPVDQKDRVSGVCLDMSHGCFRT